MNDEHIHMDKFPTFSVHISYTSCAQNQDSISLRTKVTVWQFLFNRQLTNGRLCYKVEILLA